MNKKKALTVFGLLVLSQPVLAKSADPGDIMKKNDEARKISELEAQAVLETRAAGESSPSKVKRFTWSRKLNSDEIHYKLLTRFHFPPEIKGEGILFIEQPEVAPDVLLYLPAFKKIRRVEGSAQSGSFMGSEFSYTDILSFALSDFKYRFVKEETRGGQSFNVIESTPVSDAVKTRAGFDHKLDWIRKDNNMIAVAEYYDGAGKLLKKLSASKFVEVDPAHHKWMALKMEMENQTTKQSTTIEFSEARANFGLGDQVFTPRNLEKGS